MTVITRFAPSPTGYLHIGGARTALFCWLFAKHHGGKFLLRIEDTDRQRSTPEAIEAILNGLQWLGLDWDDEPYFQSQMIERHQEVAQQLLSSGHAYRCYLSPEELQKMREEAQAKNLPLKVESPWRDRDPKEAPEGVDPVIRFKAPRGGTITVNDRIQGSVTIPNDEIDDLVILRSDGTPTYMLAVVADDHAMGITHVIRGDDHLTNTFKQKAMYEALGWTVPEFAHVSLIHGPDGAKLSKRHGALGVDAYREMGYLPEGLRNYLLRLGWSHGDDEIIPTDKAVEWFNLEAIGTSPSRIDFHKMASINAHYLHAYDDVRLTELLEAEFAPVIAETCRQVAVGKDYAVIQKAMPLLKPRAHTVKELAQQAAFLVKRLPYTEKAKEQLDEAGRAIVAGLLPKLEALGDWNEAVIKETVKTYADENSLKLGKVFPPLRAGVCGTMEAPDLAPVLVVLGKEEVIRRLSGL